jgi:hypothetical protein
MVRLRRPARVTISLSAGKGGAARHLGSLRWKRGERCVQRTEVVWLTWLEKLGGRVCTVEWEEKEGEVMLRT